MSRPVLKRFCRRMRATASAVDPVPGRLGLEERLGRLDLAPIRSRTLESLIADPTWLVVHIRNPFGSEKAALNIRDNALRNSCQEINAMLANW